MRIYEIVSREPIPSIRRIRSIVPIKLAAIPDDDLILTFQALRNGHATDNIKNHPLRSRVDALDAMAESLNILADECQSNGFGIYRTIEVDDPVKWVRENLIKTTRLGIYWSFNEEYTVAHAEDTRVLFYAHADISAIDWSSTILLNVDGVESEVRLRQGAEIKLIWVDPAVNVKIIERQIA